MNCRTFIRVHIAQVTMMAITLFAVSFNVNAQTYVSVAPTKMNVFYIGVDNPVTIAASAAADDKVTVTIEGGNGTITKLKPGLYNVRVSSMTDECLVNVFVNGKIAGSSIFRVRLMPAPVASIGGYPSGSNLSAEVFKKQSGIGLSIKDFPFETRFEIVSYTMSVETDNKDLKVAECHSGLFCEQAKQLLEQNVKSGRTVTIDGIVAKGPDGATRHLPSLVYFIK